jgi:hypothetical protein
VTRHYDPVARETASPSPLVLSQFQPPLVVVPIDHWSVISKKALLFALNISPQVIALHIACEEGTDELSPVWCRYVENPAIEIGLPAPKLVILKSPYRFIILPILDYVSELHAKNPNRQIAVIVPELVERSWYYYLLHNQRPAMLKMWLYLRGEQNTVVINVPWYFSSDENSPRPVAAIAPPHVH